MSEYVLEMKGITKSFPGVKALQSVDLYVRPGSVHAVMGENGAGKSTLMKCLLGMYSIESGEVILKGKKVSFKNTTEALKSGISMIHQELSPITERTVMENVWVGRIPGKAGFLVDHKKMRKDTVDLFERLNMDISPDEKMGDLSVARMQMVEIAKAVSYDSSIVVMDEPTSALTQSETAHLFEIIKQLKERNVAVIYISHKMDEIYEICDEISVYRDGEFVGSDYTENISIDQLITMMVGRELAEMFPKVECAIGEPVLKVENLSGKAFKDVSFELRRGEILGFAGLVGAGRTEVVETIFGMRRATGGKIYKDNKEISIKSPKDAIRHKIGMLTEDRRKSGTIGVRPVYENTVIANLKKYGFPLKKRKIRSDAQEFIDKLSVRTPDMYTQILSLSGGNQQKVLVGRWLLTDPDILFVDEPTRGIDVGAKAEIHTLITKLAGEGKAIIMVSSEMPEILGMSDRILVMCQGKMSAIINRDEATQELVMEHATGEFTKEENEQ